MKSKATHVCTVEYLVSFLCRTRMWTRKLSFVARAPDTWRIEIVNGTRFLKLLFDSYVHRLTWNYVLLALVAATILIGNGGNNMHIAIHVFADDVDDDALNSVCVRNICVCVCFVWCACVFIPSTSTESVLRAYRNNSVAESRMYSGHRVERYYILVLLFRTTAHLWRYAFCVY